MTPGSAQDLAARIRRFITEGGDDDAAFDALAREAHGFQLAHSPALARLAARRGGPGQAPASWREIPLVPTRAFRSVDLALAGLPPAEAAVFRSSGTTQRTGQSAGQSTGTRSVHHHGFLGLYRATIDTAFPSAVLPGGGGERLPMLALVPPRDQLPDSSLSFMVDHVVHTWAEGPTSVYAFGPAGVDPTAATAWAAACSAQGRPVVVLATAFALTQWLEEQPPAAPLPAGSVVFETGGFKGRRRELSRAELGALVGRTLGVPAGRIVREYGMTELTSQFYTRALQGGDPDLFVPSPGTRLRVLDPVTWEEAPLGSPGLVAIFDLANLSSALSLVTEDWGVLEAAGLRLLGRAPGATLRGCSLVAEELAP